MNHINLNFLKLQKNYLFADIARRVSEYEQKNPEAKIIRMGIGDVTLPLASSCIQAMHEAVEEQASARTLKGYGPEQGYSFLRSLIAINDFQDRGIDIQEDEIFISDGAKSDTANITDLFSDDIRIAITDPVYPVYVDSNVIAGRGGDFDTKTGKWSNFIYLPCNAGNNFIPELPEEEVHLIYLCFPNNPTGTTLTKEQLRLWVDYALEHKALILFDAAYEAYITESGVPRSIYEIEGAKRCAIEFRSFSKTAGFTGVRCGYTIVPHDLYADVVGEKVALNPLWSRRQSTKFNGASYISQRGAAAIYTQKGKEEVREIIGYYLKNAQTIKEAFVQANYTVFGGVNAPYIWIKTPDGFPRSWDFFDYLLNEKQVVGTPGVGFGPEGEGYFRLSAFNTHELTLEAMQRIIH